MTESDKHADTLQRALGKLRTGGRTTGRMHSMLFRTPCFGAAIQDTRTSWGEATAASDAFEAATGMPIPNFNDSRSDAQFFRDAQEVVDGMRTEPSREQREESEPAPTGSRTPQALPAGQESTVPAWASKAEQQKARFERRHAAAGQVR